MSMLITAFVELDLCEITAAQDVHVSVIDGMKSSPDMFNSVTQTVNPL